RSAETRPCRERGPAPQDLLPEGAQSGRARERRQAGEGEAHRDPRAEVEAGEGDAPLHDVVERVAPDGERVLRALQQAERVVLPGAGGEVLQGEARALQQRDESRAREV